MQSSTLDDSAPRGFAGLAHLAVPVDDLLSDVAARRQSESATDVEMLLTGQRTPTLPRSADRRQTKGRWLSLGLIALIAGMLVTGSVLWRTDNTDAVIADQASDAEPIVNNASLVKPSIGSGQVLSRAEIRYCLSEEVRLKAARNQAATVAIDVVRLNASVSDLNARCSAYQYGGDDLVLAEADVRVRAKELIASGQRDFLLPVGAVAPQQSEVTVSVADESKAVAATDAGETKPSPTRTQDSADAEAEGLKEVRDVQWLLFKLGYYNGVMSGVDSEATQAARDAFLSKGGHDPASDMVETLALLQAENTEGGTKATEAVTETPAPTDDVVAAEVTSISKAETAEQAADNQVALARAESPDLSGLRDADRLAIEQLCRARSSAEDYAPCIATQLVKLEAAPQVSLSELSEGRRGEVLAECGPLRGREGPAAYYGCLAENAVETTEPAPVVSTASDDLPQRVVSAIESRCSAQVTGEDGEYARCVSGQFANLGAPMKAVFISSLEFSERSSIENVCTRDAGLGSISGFYQCVQAEMADLQQTGDKPDMKVASFEHRKDIESACRQDRLAEGPADYYRCLRAQLTARGY